MSEFPHPIYRVLQNDPRYTLEAYNFVRESLSYAQEVMGMGVAESVPGGQQSERHLTGQQLCEASRRYALEQYGLMAQACTRGAGASRRQMTLAKSCTNLIEVDLMKKSDHDRREDFDGVFDFEAGLCGAFEFNAVDETEL